MKKVIVGILSCLMLLSSSLIFTACKDTTPPPEDLELSTVELTTENVSTYLACNVEYSEFTIQTINETTYYIVKATLTTAPRIKDIVFEEVFITYDDFWFSSNWQCHKFYASLDYQGYSTTSTYIYSIETTNFNKYDLPPQVSGELLITKIKGNVIVPMEKEQ